MLVENDYFDLFLRDTDVIIRTKLKGYSLKSFDKIIQDYPRLKILSFSTLRNSFKEIGIDHIIGYWLPLVEATVSEDKLNVHLTIHATKSEIKEKKNEILMDINDLLNENNIVYGRRDLSSESFKIKTPILAAKGEPPNKGADAIITYIEQPERKPVIREDGSANHYEMNFVFPIKEGDWLGEKTPAQFGEDGIDVYGNTMPSIKGLDIPLEYDSKSVRVFSEDGKEILRALHDGALEFIDNKVVVGKHLVIDEDVGVETGSITFDGAVTINGTVSAGYSVVATGDIAINGDEGVTNAKKIQSLEGGIYIRGGVFGGGVTVVEARKDIYLKHANNCKLYSEELHVGLYLFGSEVVANDVFVDKNNGKIIGGTVDATFTIECATVGNAHERKTFLQARGIDKKAINKEIQQMAQDIKKRQETIEKLEEHATLFKKNMASFTIDQNEAYEKVIDTIEKNKAELTKIDQEIQLNFQKVKNARTPQIEITKEAFPGTIIQVEKTSSTLRKNARGQFKIIEGELSY